MKQTLYRSPQNRIIAGVCGGLADYFSIDANVIRIVAVALIPAGGASVLAYLVAWAIVPVQPPSVSGETD